MQDGLRELAGIALEAEDERMESDGVMPMPGLDSLHPALRDWLADLVSPPTTP